MIEAINPFQDPEFKKSLLRREGKLDNSGDEEYDDMKSIISGAPIIPKNVGNLIMDASSLAKNEREEKANKLTNSLNQVFSEYNQQYGTDLSISFNDLSHTLLTVADPKSRRTLELFVSEIFSSMRPILILHLIQKLTLAIDYVTDTERLFNNPTLTTADIFVVIEKLMQYIDQLKEMQKDIVISGADLELKKIAEENNVDFGSPSSQAAVDSFMRLFTNEFNKKE